MVVFSQEFGVFRKAGQNNNSFFAFCFLSLVALRQKKTDRWKFEKFFPKWPLSVWFQLKLTRTWLSSLNAKRFA